jgi:prepilin-type N-terminal cleavage/methylation domain-containing protein
MRGRRNWGFTLVELLVVIAIIGVLIALLLPAVQSAREAARRLQCANNLKQLGLAVHTYHDAHQSIPISISPWPGEAPNFEFPRSGKGWLVAILPQIEQQAMYDQFDFTGEFFSSRGIKNRVNDQLLGTQLPAIVCPSDQSSRDRNLWTKMFQMEDRTVALTNYKGVIGDTRMGGGSSAFPGTEPDCHNTSPCNGSFWRNSFANSIRFPDYVDGLSQTFIIGEDVPEHNYHSAWAYSNGDYSSCHVPLNYFPEPPDPAFWPNAIAFKSRHTGGGHFALGDASVHFIAEGIEHPIYRAYATRDASLSNQNPEPIPSGGF